MNAVHDYRNWWETPCPFHHPHDIKRKADAAIAELQAELAALKAKLSWIEGQPRCCVGDVLVDWVETGMK